ncbi:MAG: benzylsuccinate synthase gamma subunit family protein [Syntrophobacteraceae bacterium]
MATCSKCASFFKVPDTARDYEAGKGDCVIEHKDQKGKFWTTKPVFETNEACKNFNENKKLH